MKRELRTVVVAVPVAAVVLVGAAACGAQRAADTAGTASPHSPASSARPSGRTTAGIAQPVVLVRTGGIAGAQDRVEVRPDGTCTVSGRGRPASTRALSAAELAGVARALQQAHVETLTPQPTGRARSDQYSYALTAQGRTVTVSETTAPPALRPLLDVLSGLVDRR